MHRGSLLSAVTGNQRPEPGAARARGVKEGTGSQSFGVRGPSDPSSPRSQSHTH